MEPGFFNVAADLIENGDMMFVTVGSGLTIEGAMLFIRHGSPKSIVPVLMVRSPELVA